MTDRIDLAVRIVLTVLMFLPLTVGIILKKRNELDTRKTCTLIIVTGVILRTLYIYYTGIDVRQHDVGRFFAKKGGHSEYILYLYKHHKLPDFDPRKVIQFYHPPLHHIICALWLRLLRIIGISIKAVPETFQFLTLTYSTLFCVFAYKALVRLKLKPHALQTATALVTFHPTLIILSGSINNDMLSGLFGMMAVYYAIKWSQDRKWLSIIMIGLSIGLGMFTKLTIGLLAPGVAAVFIVVFIKRIKDWKRLILQFVTFGIICVPLGLFWPVRNYVKFGMPLNYVPRLSESSMQFIDISSFERIIDYRLYQFSSPFTQWILDGHKYNEYNPIIALLKNAMFDESTFFMRSITLQSFCTSLLFCNIIISIIAVISLIMIWVKNKNTKLELKLLITMISAVIFGNYIIFCINYPHVCTENMRYCIPLIFTTAAVCGLLMDRKDLNKRLFSLYKRIVPKCTAVFCLLSCFVYTVMVFYYR